MTQQFSDTPTLPKRALQIWQILIGKAYNRQTVTYGQLADMIGYAGAGTLGQNLDYLLCYCQIYQLPPITNLVVNKDTGLPGEGPGFVLAQLHADRERVYQFNWYGLVPPTPEEFAATHKQLRG
jgi:putative restriction endonuclease